ncbi:MAG TPA: PAS domain S-box protein [Gemmatimonadaceae bacterium]|nr:PAS domain S-box protein [Gemmatimonadaceae bacterium]
MSRPAKSIRSRPAERLHSDVPFAAAFDNAPHAMALVGSDGMLLHVNRALCRMLGFGGEELVDANISVITHPDDLETEWEQRQRLARADIGRYELVQRYLSKDGESIWVRLSVSATRQPSSELACFVLHAEAVAAPPSYPVADEPEVERLQRFNDAALSAMHEIGNTLTPLMVNTELIVEHSRNQPIAEFAKEIFKAARRIAFTLRRLRRVDDATSPVAYLGEERMLDLRMIAPPTRPLDDAGNQRPRVLDSEDQQHQN